MERRSRRGAAQASRATEFREEEKAKRKLARDKNHSTPKSYTAAATSLWRDSPESRLVACASGEIRLLVRICLFTHPLIPSREGNGDTLAPRTEPALAGKLPFFPKPLGAPHTPPRLTTDHRHQTWGRPRCPRPLRPPGPQTQDLRPPSPPARHRERSEAIPLGARWSEGRGGRGSGEPRYRTPGRGEGQKAAGAG